MKQSRTIHLGYEVGSGEPVAIPMGHHVAVTGQTQQSGKTTTLEAMVIRSGATAISFLTKRGEENFSTGRRIDPYFRDRADWQFVDQLLEAQLHEKNKFLRSWVIKVCRKTRTLADVHREVRQELSKARSGTTTEGVYTQLDAYLELIVPEIAGMNFADKLDLCPGLNVMDLSELRSPMQMLLIQSAIDWINEREKNTVVVIPEAWEMIPEGKGSPVKASAVSLVRKGAGIGNLIWPDSQDMAGVDKTILRGCTVWIIGVQREPNEIKRTLSSIPAGVGKPKAADIALLERGQFFACFGRHTIKTYVQPAWMSESEARAIAMGMAEIPQRPDELARTIVSRDRTHVVEECTPGPAEEPTPYNRNTNSEEQMENDRLDKLTDLVEKLVKRDAGSRTSCADVPVGTSHAPSNGHLTDELWEQIKSRILGEPKLLKVAMTQPVIELVIEQQIVTADGKTLRGRVASMIKRGFFDAPVRNGAVVKECGRTGNTTNSADVSRVLNKLVSEGFLTDEADGYQSVKSATNNIR